MMGTEGQQTAGLNALRHSAGLMRSVLTKTMNLRQAPYLKFHIDEGLQKELALMELSARWKKNKNRKTKQEKPRSNHEERHQACR